MSESTAIKGGEFLVKKTSFKDFVGEKIKIAAKYWAHTNTKILYALTAEKILKNLSVMCFAF